MVERALDLGRTPEADKVIQVALRNFARRGYVGTTTRAIAQSLEKSPAIVYTYFKSKHDLLYQIVLQGHEELYLKILAARDSETTPVPQIQQVAHTHATFHAQHSDLARVANYELYNLKPSALKEVLEIRSRIQNTVREIVVEGSMDGLFHVADLDLATIAILSLGIDVSRWFRSSGRLTIEEVGLSYAAFVLRLLGAIVPAEQMTPSTWPHRV